ncbi:hypothetical protein Btru_075790 [Bulinus truncatus]|nr:hypothetical protein Btru_075790 [Bulinus truncatus]
MLWLLNSVPVIGHVKGLIHYACGNNEEGNKAMCEATRSTVVIAGGLIGTVGGPGLSAGVAICVGTCFDAVATGVTGEPHGNIKNITDIKKDIDNGNVPLMPVASTVFTVVTDGLSGILVSKLVKPTQYCVGNSVARAASNSVGAKTTISVTKSTAASVTKETAKSVTKSAAESVTKEKAKSLTKQAVDFFIISTAGVTPVVIVILLFMILYSKRKVQICKRFYYIHLTECVIIFHFSIFINFHYYF